MKERLWQEPAHLAGAPVTGSGSEQVLRSMARSMDLGSDTSLVVERQRLAGRSTIHVVSARAAGREGSRWIVKQPHPGWSQDDVSNPLGARQEFEALVRLDEHFGRLGLPFRVPQPVAFLPEVDAVVMEYVDGVTVKDLLHYGSLRRPRRLLDGLSASGAFLRHLHGLEALPPLEIDLARQADRVLAVAEEKLRPLGLDLPAQVRRTLLRVPSTRVSAPHVRLHGDFGPANILLARDGSTVGLDVSLEATGAPEEDLVRYVALTSGIIRLAPELVVPPLAAVRREMQNRLLAGYYGGTTTWPPLFELTYLHQLSRRWCRSRELAVRNASPARLAIKMRVIGAQMRVLMCDSAQRLTRVLEG